jgi:hypothetical protein
LRCSSGLTFEKIWVFEGGIARALAEVDVGFLLIDSWLNAQDGLVFGRPLPLRRTRQDRTIGLKLVLTIIARLSRSFFKLSNLDWVIA